VAVVRVFVRTGAIALMLTALAGGPAASAAPTLAARCPAWDGVQPPTGNGWLNAVVVLPSCQAWGAGNTSGSDGSAATLVNGLTGSSWARFASPQPGSESTLQGVTATSAGNTWAVGADSPSDGGRQPVSALILHWTGSAWARSKSPQPGSSQGYNGLFAVAASSPGDVWAVGSYAPGTAGHPAKQNSGHRTLIVHWNGTNWSRVPSPDPGIDSRLTSIAIVTAKDAWAVGYYRTANVFRQTLILHWNGQTWKKVPSPSPGPGHQAVLFGVTATSARTAWAVGYTLEPSAATLVLHWNGSTWTRQPSPNPVIITSELPIDQLQGVTATSAKDAWAVGYYRADGENPVSLVLHWNGRAWSQVSVPQLGGENDNLLYAVSAASAGDVWAVGEYVNGDEAVGLALHWNGATWRQ
jgi:hypothetical protein